MMHVLVKGTGTFFELELHGLFPKMVKLNSIYLFMDMQGKNVACSGRVRSVTSGINIIKTAALYLHELMNTRFYICI